MYMGSRLWPKPHWGELTANPQTSSWWGGSCPSPWTFPTLGLHSWILGLRESAQKTRVLWAIKIAAKGSSSLKRLKNTALDIIMMLKMWRIKQLKNRRTWLHHMPDRKVSNIWTEWWYFVHYEITNNYSPYTDIDFIITSLKQHSCKFLAVVVQQ